MTIPQFNIFIETELADSDHVSHAAKIEKNQSTARIRRISSSGQVQPNNLGLTRAVCPQVDATEVGLAVEAGWRRRCRAAQRWGPGAPAVNYLRVG